MRTNMLATRTGMLTTAKPVHTVKDEPMEFATFDDGHGLIETVLFPVEQATPAAHRAMLASQIDLWRSIIEKAGIQTE